MKLFKNILLLLFKISSFLLPIIAFVELIATSSIFGGIVMLVAFSMLFSLSSTYDIGNIYDVRNPYGPFHMWY
ncbi:MAG: hypothetical protein E6248_06195 [Clostridium sp.]|uniref:hypothetical protein n=1 Tax=Clostridium sp. TaxID=1506 RepID=UPI002910EDEC|nr:hypothetical protein [Clostridium sp.]MDU5110018.1 hypothetical protein [Clostridium sp.]